MNNRFDLKAVSIFATKVLLLALLACAQMLGQGVRILPGATVTTPGGVVPNPTVRVCSEPASGTTCTPLVNAGLFLDRAMTVATTNPAVGDLNGNMPIVYTAPGRVHLQINGPGLQQQIDISDVVLSDATQPVIAFQVVPFAASETYDTAVATAFQTTLTGNVTSVSMVNDGSSSITVGRSIILKLCQDNVGGRTFTWPAAFLNPPNISTIGANNCVDIPWWFDGTNWNPSGSPSLLGSVSLSSVTPGATSPGTYDFSGATIVKMPVVLGFSTSSNGSLGYDSTNKNWHFFDNGGDAINVVIPASTPPTSSDCAAWNVSSGAITLADNGGPCAATATATAHNFLTSYSATTGSFAKAQPACGDLSNASPSCSADATNASNISSGTLPAARLPNPSASTLGGIESFAAVSHEWVNQISTAGVPSATQPACGDLSNAAPSCSTDTTNAGNITAGTLQAARMNPTVSAHTYLGNNGSGSVPASFVQPVAGDLQPGINGQCVITSGGVSVWGSCAGTAGEQVLSVNNTSVTVNSSTTGNQTMMSFTSGSGQFNVAQRIVKVSAWGTVQTSTSLTTFVVWLAVGANTTPCGTAGWTVSNINTGTIVWRISCTLFVTVTGNNGGFAANEDYFVNPLNGNALISGIQASPTIIPPVNWQTAVSITTTVNFSTASTSNACTQQGMLVEQLI